MDALTPDETCAMFVHVARRIEESKDELTDADRATGDGDHGVVMARGFGAVRVRLEGGGFETAGDVVRAVGRELLSSMGGASGVLFATFFSAGATDGATFDADALRRLLVDGSAAVQARGKAARGDKTMLDALAPAAEKALELPQASLSALLLAATEAARGGVEQTTEMVARRGKAKALGERSRGHADPGALSSYLILRAMAEYVSAGPDPDVDAR